MPNPIIVVDDHQLLGPPSDYDKIMQSLSTITSISSFDDVLSMFGLLDMPRAQRLGIAFGILTFVLTVCAVLTLLTLGGTWRRIEQQSRAGSSAIAPDSVSQRRGRALLMDRLLEMREWMMMTNYPSCGVVVGEEGGGRGGEGTTTTTPLTKMLMMAGPPNPRGIAPDDEGYEENYKAAYLRCQDKPGGPILGGRPSHRFEAYARAFAGCGSRTTLSYRFSYARMYESLSGKSHESDETYSKLHRERPHDIIGRTCRLEMLDVYRHSCRLYDITSGKSMGEHKSYDPYEVWCFLDCGPFDDATSLIESEVFRLRRDQAGFAIVNSITDKLVGVIHLTNDDPKNLRVQIELPIVGPYMDDSVEVMEAYFLLLDRLFAYGYRRVQMCIDSQDVKGKRWPNRLGFTMEGELLKHMIVKDASRDNLVYGMLNSDWDKGARGFIYGKIHGDAARKADAAIVSREEANHEQEERVRSMVNEK